MKVGLIGRGAVSIAIQTALAHKHSIRLGVRNPNKEDEHSIAAAAEWADVIILATPWQAEADVAAAIADLVENKTVIDATNPVGIRDGVMDLVNPRDKSAAEYLQDRLPGSHVVKTFNQIGAEFMADAALLSEKPCMFVATDNQQARTISLELVEDSGFEAVDGGPLSNARHLESMAMVWIWSALKGPLGRSFGFSISRTQPKE